jgi:uncharacterized protein YodC (DUF2158 family)
MGSGDELMGLKRTQIPASDLVIVKRAEAPRDFRIGDVVRLNSGGPSMMIVDIAGDVTVAWRGVDGKPVEALFHPVTLSYAFDLSGTR